MGVRGGRQPIPALQLCGCLQEPPGPGAAPRFGSSAVANPAALALLLALLRRAGGEDQLWGLAAFRELLLQVRGWAGAYVGWLGHGVFWQGWVRHRLPWAGSCCALCLLRVRLKPRCRPGVPLQGAHNLAAADSAGLNGLLIAWLRDATAPQGPEADGGAAAAGQEASLPEHSDPQQQRLLLQQLLALLRLSGSYSISGEAAACCCCWPCCRA